MKQSNFTNLDGCGDAIIFGRNTVETHECRYTSARAIVCHNPELRMNRKRRKEWIDILRLGILELLKNLDFMRSIGDGAVLVEDGALVILRINVDDLDGGHTIVDKITAMFRYQQRLDSRMADRKPDSRPFLTL